MPRKSNLVPGRGNERTRKPLKVMVVAGARPNFMKLASIIDAIRMSNSEGKRRIHVTIVHTGQHYDPNMSDSFFQDLNLPAPDIQLEVGSGTHAVQTAEIMRRFEPVLLAQKPDVVLVVGDVNSTVACTLVGAKIAYSPGGKGRFDSTRIRPLMGHVEAGLRSGDRAMPEEINRILTDALSDFLFVTENSAKQNLRQEGISAHRIFFVGNTMVDTLLAHRRRADEGPFASRMSLFYPQSLGEGNTRRSPTIDYGVVTLHRPSNVDHQPTFLGIVKALRRIAKRIPLLFPVHPRTLNQMKAFGVDKFLSFDYFSNSNLLRPKPGLIVLPPLGYLDCLGLVSRARLVLTDSGGLQEETTALGVPCVTIRNNTERPITIREGSNVLAGTDPTRIERAAARQLTRRLACRRPRLWDGKAGKRIVNILLKRV